MSREVQLWNLPVRAILPEVASHLAENRPLVLQAPPGSGKTLLVAPSLLSAPWLQGRKIILLEPRRLAARLAARSMAQMLGEGVGERVGYQVRLERQVSAATRIEIVTEGLLVQRLLHDPALEEVGLVIFDEFHERNLHSDFAFALTLDARRLLRPDLRLVVMSATLDSASVTRHLGSEAATVTATSRAWPVETRYLERPAGSEPLPERVARAVRQALRETEGGILAFLPGEAEIRRAASLLQAGGAAPGVELHPLYGTLPRPQQEAAIRPAAGSRRKVVLATSIAESSITIEDVRVVIDCGMVRLPRFSPRTGMGRLVTVRITCDRADQRRGRAGRMGPGICYRLWDQATQQQLLLHALPEIYDADLAPLRLQAAAWGADEPAALPWLTAPPDAAWQQATRLLQQLGALDNAARPTARGRKLAHWPLHPRLAHMIAEATRHTAPRQAVELAALLEESGGGAAPLRYETDVRRLLELLQQEGDSGEVAAWRQRIRRLAQQWSRGFPAQDQQSLAVGRLLSWAFPDRVAQQRGSRGHYLTTAGSGARLEPEELLANSEWLALATLQESEGGARIRLAAPLDPADLASDFADQLESEAVVRWDRREERVHAWRRQRLGALILREAPLGKIPPEARLQALADGISEKGIANLGWNSASRNLQARVALLRQADPGGNWPDLSDQALAVEPTVWLAPWLAEVTRWEQIKRIDLVEPLLLLLGAQRRRLEILAPTHWLLPNGRRVALRYDQGEEPVLAAPLQELFGLQTTPAIVEGRVPLVVHLLSPARRPIAITSDLAGFWRSGYQLVRKEYRGRYPKHAWPENPAENPAENARRQK